MFFYFWGRGSQKMPQRFHPILFTLDSVTFNQKNVSAALL